MCWSLQEDNRPTSLQASVLETSCTGGKAGLGRKALSYTDLLTRYVDIEPTEVASLMLNKKVQIDYFAVSMPSKNNGKQL